MCVCLCAYVLCLNYYVFAHCFFYSCINVANKFVHINKSATTDELRVAGHYLVAIILNRVFPPWK